FSSRRRYTRFSPDWSSDVCSSDLLLRNAFAHAAGRVAGLSARALRSVQAMEKAGWAEEELGYLVPTKRGLEHALSVVDTEVSSLLERALRWDDDRKLGRNMAS